MLTKNVKGLETYTAWCWLSSKTWPAQQAYFLRILSTQRRKQGECEARVAPEEERCRAVGAYKIPMVGP